MDDIAIVSLAGKRAICEETSKGAVWKSDSRELEKFLNDLGNDIYAPNKIAYAVNKVREFGGKIIKKPLKESYDHKKIY